ncbi:MAG: galactose-1-epimerase [Bacteroidales bacterium]|nr:galactose-1-epimerase [Bacteroidales bacterium]
MKKLVLFAVAVLMLAGCAKKQVQLIDAANFNKEVDGKQVSLYTLHNGDVTMQVTNYGGRVVALWTPDKRGSYEDITLGYDGIDKYLDNPGERYLGAVVGRCANRIAGGTFTLNDSVYQLVQNDGRNTLHGGALGTDRVVWDVLSANDSCLVMHVVLPDGQDGFPGNLDITMTYTLTSGNDFRIDYAATTDRPTLCNLSNHTFFNLKGEGSDILDHQLEINSTWMMAVDSTLIPTGFFVSVKDTPFDFLTLHPIGERIGANHIQLERGHGYDHNWIINRKTQSDVEHVATLFEPKSRRQVEVLSDQMGLQFYSGNFFDGKAQGKWGAHVYRGAVALETQQFPDAINQEKLVEKPILNPGETYTHTCIYRFSVAPQK